ncbi:MAG TPA: hypothetical protein PLR96_11165, partial [Flavobacteriales bacterium]|nr:hypothetical protein [Flavobacteriales bacterium]
TSGNLLWQRSFGGSSYDYCAAAHPTADGGYLLGGTTFSTNGDVAANNGFADYLVVKFADATNGLHTLRSDAPFHLLPNPVQDELIVELALEGPARTHVLLSNAPGQQLATVFDEHRSTGTHRIRIPVQHLAPGIHHLHVRINDRSFLRTWVKL